MIAAHSQALLPHVAVVIVNFNGQRFLDTCLNALAATDYPRDRFEVIVVDNASSDRSAAYLRDQFPWVRVLALSQNLGFAGGNNAGMCATDAPYIVLLNNDTAVEPGWLAALVRAAETDHLIGACGAKLVFFYEALPLTLTVEHSFVPAHDLPDSSDTRVLGVRLAQVNLVDAQPGAQIGYTTGWYDLEGSGAAAYRWSADRAVLSLPVADRTVALDLMLHFAGGPPDPLPPASVRMAVGDVVLRTVEIGADMVEVLLSIPPDLLAQAQRYIQNAGQELLPGGYCRDRGSYVEAGVEQHVPDGSYEQQDDVFGVCGAAVLLKRAMLDQIGLLDDRFFMYYEDTDLCWRAHFAGWRMVYVPDAVVRHIHSGSSGAWSPFFRFHVERNRLFMLIKNAPLSLAAGAVAAYARETAAWLGRSVRAVPHGQRSVRNSLFFVINNLRVLLSLVKTLPYLLRQRWTIRRTATVDDAAILRWMVR